MKKKFKTETIFKTKGQPNVTYVKREEGVYENQLSSSIDNGGSCCLITGPSKTGKTTLYKKVAKDKKLELILIRCSSSLTTAEVWKKALEQVNFERVEIRQDSSEFGVEGKAKVGGKLGWAWLAHLSGEISAGMSLKNKESESRQKILSNPSNDHLIPILKNLQYLFVIEDFHYLKKEVQIEIAQQWKGFVDEEISIVIVSTTHHAVDLANSNPDLSGRISQIDLSNWEIDDLKKIIVKGFQYYNLPIKKIVTDTIANESVGLPIVTQSVCQELLKSDNDKLVLGNVADLTYTKQNVFKALHQVAIQRYSNFSAIFNRFSKGARKYNTYEFILTTFSMDPIKFSLDKIEIEKRLKNLPIIQSAIPPKSSIESTLKALKGFQENLGIELLEWMPNDDKLYISEPIFLFYIRWRIERTLKPSILDLFSGIERIIKLLKN